MFYNYVIFILIIPSSWFPFWRQFHIVPTLSNLHLLSPRNLFPSKFSARLPRGAMSWRHLVVPCRGATGVENGCSMCCKPKLPENDILRLTHFQLTGFVEFRAVLRSNVRQVELRQEEVIADLEGDAFVPRQLQVLLLVPVCRQTDAASAIAISAQRTHEFKFKLKVQVSFILPKTHYNYINKNVRTFLLQGEQPLA